MRRVLPLVLLLIVLAVGIFWMLGRDRSFEGPGFDAQEVLRVEHTLRLAPNKGGGPDGARAELERLGPEISAPARLYLESVIQFSEAATVQAAGRTAEAKAAYAGALASAQQARREHQDEWRPVSAEYAALRALDRVDEAGRLILPTVGDDGSRRYDERFLVLAAQHHLSLPEPNAVEAKTLLERARALSERVASSEDPTAIRDDYLSYLLGQARLASGRRFQALDLARQSVRRWPGDAKFHILLGDAAQASGRLEEATAAYRGALDLVPENHPQSRLWRENYVQLLIATNARGPEIVEATDPLMKSWGNLRSVRVLRARALVRADRLDQAADIYQELLGEDPNDPQVLRNLAVIYYDWKQGGQEGEYREKCYRWLRDYVRLGGEIDASLADVWRVLVEHAAGGTADDPLAGLRTKWEAAPGDVELTETYLHALRSGGHVKEGGLVIRRGLEAAPSNPAMAVVAARWFLGSGPDYDAVEAVGRAETAASQLAKSGEVPEAVLWLRARARLAARRYEQAHEDARLLLARRQAAPYFQLLGAAARGLGRLRECEQGYRAALSLEPSRLAWRSEYLDMLLDAVHALPEEEAERAEATVELILKQALAHMNKNGGPLSLAIVRSAALAQGSESGANGVTRLESILDKHPDNAMALKHFARAALAMKDKRAVRQRFRQFGEAGGRLDPVLDQLQRDAAE